MLEKEELAGGLLFSWPFLKGADDMIVCHTEDTFMHLTY